MLSFHFRRDHCTFNFCHPSLRFYDFCISRIQDLEKCKGIRGVAKSEGAVIAPEVKKEHVLLLFFCKF